MGLQVNAVFLDPEGRLVVLDVTHVSKQSFRLVAVYAPKECKQAGYCRYLKSFLVMSKTLALLGDFNNIFNVRVDIVGSTYTRGNHGFKSLLESYTRKVDPYRLFEPLISQLIWNKNGGSKRSYLDRLLIKSRDGDMFSCLRC